MAKTPGIRGIRAAFADATDDRALAAAPLDPPPDIPRDIVINGKSQEVRPGEWPGAPTDRLPPGCEVVPLGVNGHTSFFIDGLGQILDFEKLGHDDLLKLFRMTPNALTFYWPRWSAPKGRTPPRINGTEVREAAACLLKAAGARGLFDPAGKIRGRGAWRDRYGRIVWHAGDALFMVEGTGDKAKLKASPAGGEIDNMFYPRRPKIMAPWPEPVPHRESPAPKIYQLLKSWSWERPQLDPLIVLGHCGAMFLSGALPWRPHGAAMGDRGTGKSSLQALIKGLLDSVLLDAANATEAGIRQYMALDALPVALDEFEASDDNRRNNAIIELARIASSGGRMLRGGQDHQGVEFLARSTFFASGILLPPMKAQDRSRFAVLNLNKLDVGDAEPPVIGADDGRMILRSLMDSWPDFEATLGDWKAILRDSGLDGRAQDTYGTIFALAHLMLGNDAMQESGLPIDDPKALGALIAAATAEERASQVDGWQQCLEHLLSKSIDAWKGGEKPSIGELVEVVEKTDVYTDDDKRRMAAAGCALIEEADPSLPAGKRKYLLAVPVNSTPLNAIFEGTRWKDGGWAGALKQGRAAGVVRPPDPAKGDKVVKIQRVATRCLLVDLKAYDKLMEGST